MWSDEMPLCPLTGQWCDNRCAWYLEDEVSVENEDRTYQRCAAVAFVDALQDLALSIRHGLF